MAFKMKVVQYVAKRNQKKAVQAWSSWQRFVRSGEPVMVELPKR
jgi:hypothetical protein